MRCSSRVSALRRELNSHNAASREHRAVAATPPNSGTLSGMRCSGKGHFQQVHRVGSNEEPNPNDRERPCQLGLLHCVGCLGFRSVCRAAASLYADIHGPWRRLEDVARHGRQRGAGSLRGLPSKDGKVTLRTSRRASLPNPSLKPSPNSKVPGPVCGAVHSPQPGPGIFLPVPA